MSANTLTISDCAFYFRPSTLTAVVADLDSAEGDDGLLDRTAVQELRNMFYVALEDSIGAESAAKMVQATRD